MDRTKLRTSLGMHPEGPSPPVKVGRFGGEVSPGS